LQRIDALPADLDLIEMDNATWGGIRPHVEEALSSFVPQALGSGRGLTTAMKILYMKRPRLIPPTDPYTRAMLGVRLRATPTHEQSVSAGMLAIDVMRREGRRNHEALGTVGEVLRGKGLERSPVRILDGVLWITY
jgi:hypothetical protein